MRLQDRALQLRDEPIRPGMPGLGAGVANPQRPTGLIEGVLELGAAVGQHPVQRPARRAVSGRQGVAQEPGGVDRGVGGQHRGGPIRTRDVASDDLPHLTDAFEFADGEGIQRDQFTGLGGLQVARAGMPRVPRRCRVRSVNNPTVRG